MSLGSNALRMASRGLLLAIALLIPTASWAQGPPLCILNPTNYVYDEDQSANPPTLTFGGNYNCEQCGTPVYSGSILVTGTGHCDPAFPCCYPSPIEQTWAATWARMKVQNKKRVIVCTNDTINSKYRECSCSGDCENTPIILSLEDRSLPLTSWQQGVPFDLDTHNDEEMVSWTDPRSTDDVFLVLDRNGNGVVDDGSELFGNKTPQPPSPEPNGFEALAVFDDSLSGGNEDGQIDPQDRIYEQLAVWLDENHNGDSEPHELRTLSEAGIEWIALSYWKTTRVDRHGNRYAFQSEIGVGGRIRPSWDVYLTFFYP